MGKRIATLDVAGRDVDGRLVLVAEVERRVVGFLTVGPGRDSGMDSSIELMSLYVHPDLHASGEARPQTGLPNTFRIRWVA